MTLMRSVLGKEGEKVNSNKTQSLHDRFHYQFWLTFSDGLTVSPLSGGRRGSQGTHQALGKHGLHIDPLMSLQPEHSEVHSQ